MSDGISNIMLRGCGVGKSALLDSTSTLTFNAVYKLTIRKFFSCICASIGKGSQEDHWLNWTFHDLPFGGKYEIKVQSLLSNLKNYVVQSIVLPKLIDICNEIGRKCHWEQCFPVNDFHQEKANAVLAWRLSKYHKAPSGFEIYYKSSEINCNDIGRRKLKNATRVVLELHKCSRYHVKVRPIFSDGEKGTFSKEIVFFPPQKPTGRPRTESYTNVEVVDVIVSCSVTFVLLVVAIIAAIIIKRKRKHQSSSLLTGLEVIPNPSHHMLLGDRSGISLKKTKIFIVHDNHCRTCNNVTHSLANLLNETSYVECILDICCTNEITDRGMIWYEDKIKLCDKVIVVCTRDGKTMYEENDHTNDGPYVFILKMLLGQMIHHQNRKLHIIPLCFDISSHEDIPLFLSEHACYSIPSQIQKLLSAVLPENLSSSSGEPSIYDSSSEAALLPSIKRLKETIEMVRRDHKGYY
ncbi:uncharacterized protein LOC114529178 isoform X2 [Dendronephthya gigantea]|uniref:uncharacterized protein LOC114529178 isoform X2 n=1 Tax=Dendronephthya gigantea TaxID=151771 RepID=UPI00106BBD25|nr:uncharacterized protein LOC114529178 isoform X2 [Dendronephthya gigantea]